jgi:hypothetical protein
MAMNHFRILYIAFVTAAVLILVGVWSFQAANSRRNGFSRKKGDNNTMSSKTKGPGSSISVAHLGNSIQYYDDLPRLLEHLLQTRFETVRQNSCLRGGATLPSLFENGNGMANKFSSRPEVAWLPGEEQYDIGAPTVKALLTSPPLGQAWDFVIMNDNTQSPARPEKKEESLEALRTKYLPLLKSQGYSGEPNQDCILSTTILFLQTAAYKSTVKDSADLGTFDEFTSKLKSGYYQYVDLIREEGKGGDGSICLDARIAPVGLAYQYIKDQYGQDTWAKLYALDDFHPSPHGTFLEACVLYCAITNEYPPEHDVAWWKTARYMQPPETDPLPLPSGKEADLIREVAWKVYRNEADR